MEPFGPTFREIRLAKGIKLKDVAVDIVSLQFLTKFEKGESDMSLTNFYRLLERVFVDFDEFMRHYALGQLGLLEQFEEELDQLLDERNALKMRKMRKKYEDAYATEGDLKFYYLALIIAKASQRLNPRTPEVIDLSPIKDHLDGIDTWGKFEYLLATYSENLLSIEELHYRGTTCYQKVSHQGGMRARVNDFIISTTFVLIKHQELEKASELLAYYKAHEVGKQVVNLPTHLLVQFLTGAIKLCQGDDSGSQEVNQTLRALELVEGFDMYANRLYQTIEFFLNDNHLTEKLPLIVLE